MRSSNPFYIGLLAATSFLSSAAPIPGESTVTITVSNVLRNGSAITDTQNNAHINIINGGNKLAEVKDSSSNSASSIVNPADNEARSTPMMLRREIIEPKQKDRIPIREHKKEDMARQEGAKQSRGDESKISIKIENTVHDGSAITDSQNNGHINIVNGANNKTKLEDTSNNEAASLPLSSLPSPAYGSVTSKQRKRNEEQKKGDEKDNGLNGSRNSVTITVSNSVKNKSIIADVQNNGHIMVVNGGNSNSDTKDNSTNTAGSIWETLDSTAEQPSKRAPLLVSRATSPGNDVGISLGAGLNAGSNSTGSMNNNEFEIYLEGRPEGLNITVHFAVDKDSNFMDSGNGNKFRIFVGPAALESAKNTTVLEA